MARLWSALVTSTATLTVAIVIAACVAEVRGDSAPYPDADPQRPPVVAAPFMEGRVPSASVSTEWSQGLAERVQKATDDARGKGAEISVLVFDRLTGETVSSGEGTAITTASVSKLFIADDLLYQSTVRKTPLSPDDRKMLDAMLRSSDDGAGETFWIRGSGDEIVDRVAARYQLDSTRPGDYQRWWNTVTTAKDLARYYDMLLDGDGGLKPDQAEIILGDLAKSTPQGLDGYPQRFGIPDGLFAEPVAVKQGWMCCIGADWMHLSTGVIGSDRRFVMVIESLQAADDATARDTITDVVKTMFPSGRI